jgi:hypothetical protein
LNFKDTLIVGCFLFATTFLSSQRVEGNSSNMTDVGWSVGFTPTAFMTINPNFQLSGSYRFKKPIEINTEVGGLLYTRGDLNLTKAIFRTEAKFYPLKKILYLGFGYYGIYFRGSSDRFYRHDSQLFDKQFRLDNNNYQHYFVLNGGLNFKVDKNVFIKLGGRIGNGVNRSKGDQVPEGFRELFGRGVDLFPSFSLYRDEPGRFRQGFMHYYLNVSYHFGRSE